jgi:hypothetical protein
LRSPSGTSAVTPETSDRTKHFAIKPYKTQFAELTVYDDRFVTIRTYWS